MGVTPANIDARRLGYVLGAITAGKRDDARAAAKELTANERRDGALLLEEAANVLRAVDRDARVQQAQETAAP